MVRLFSVGHTAVDRYKHSFATFDPEALTLIYTTALDLFPQPAQPQPVARPTCFAAANARFGAPVGNLDKRGMYTQGWEEARVLRHEEHFSVKEVVAALQQRYPDTPGLPSRSTLYEIKKDSELPARRGGPPRYPSHCEAR